MRIQITWTLSLAFGSLHAQQPNLATLLSLADCLDTTCVSQRVRPLNYCLKGGKKEDGWMWSTCGPFDQWADRDRMVILGFFGYDNSNYRDYFIFTGDTAVADALSVELEELGFTDERPYRKGWIYLNSAYPELEIHHRISRSTSIEFKMKDDPVDPRAEPIDPECEHPELLKEARALDYDRVERISKVRFGFRVRVPTPYLFIRPSGTDGSYVLYYPVSDPVAEFTIKDLSGAVVFRSTTQDQRTELDLSGLAPGVHYLTLTSGTRTLSKAFMKN